MATTTTPPSITALLQKTSLDDHEEILRACNATLRKSKSDKAAKVVKAVALLKLDRYDEALHLFESNGKDLQNNAPLEYAYSLYKGGRPEEAVKVTSALNHQRGSKHLEAQALYRTERFSEAAEIYEYLHTADPSLEASDIRINRGAVDAQLIWSRASTLAGARKPGRADLEAFELAYNAACGCIARGDLRQANVLLKRSKELCEHSDDLSAEEKAVELLPIMVQQLCVLERLDRNKDAEAVASEVTTKEISDVGTREIAQHNIHLASPQPSNPFMTHRALSGSPTYTASDQPFRFQRRILGWNKSVVDLHAAKYDGVARSTAKLLKIHPAPSISSEITSAGVLNAAACVGGDDDDGRLALKHLVAEIEKSPFNLGLVLTVIQIHISMRNPTSATNLLELVFSRIEQSSFETKEDVRFSPGLIAVAVALYRSQGRRSRATQELERASAYWRDKVNPPTHLLLSAGCALLESSRPDHVLSARDLFQKLHKTSPTDRKSTAGYVAAFASKDLSMVEAELKQLTPVQRLIQGVDVDELERVGIRQSSNALASIARDATAGTSRKRRARDQGPSQRKSIRKSRLPKNYDPNKAPDPERWLPLRDRSTYRSAKGKKGKKRDADRTQGGIVASEGGVKDKDTTAEAGNSAAAVAGGAAGMAAKKKNKKKGRK